MSGSTRDAMNLQTLGRVLRQRLGVILTSVMIFAMLGVLINTLTPPVYRATTRIEIRRGTPEGTNNFQSENVAMFTAAALITNRGLLGNVVDDFDGRGWIRGGSPGAELQRTATEWLRRVNVPVGNPAPHPADPARRSRQIDWLEGAIVVEPVRDTRLVDIHVEHTQPEAARTIADGLIQRFAAYQTRRTSGPDSVRVKTAGGEAAQALPAANMGRAWMRARIKTLDGQVSNTTSEYYRVKSSRAEVASQLAQLERYTGDGSADGSQLPVEGGALDALRRDLVNCQTRVQAQRQVYQSNHPKIAEMNSECAALRASLRRELQRTIASKRVELASLAAREGDLRSTLSRSAIEMGEAEVQHDVQEAQLGPNPIPVWVPPIEIVDPATVAPTPVRPRKWVNLALCVVIGAMVGIGIALVRHSLRHTIRTPEDVEAELGLEVLGVIPKKSYAASW